MKKYTEIQKEVIFFLVKDSNSMELSRQLGFRFNQVNRWKNGIKICLWENFCDLCKLKNLPIESALKKTLLVRPQDGFSFDKKEKQSMAKDILLYLNKFHRFEAIADVSRQTGIHISLLKRYLSGKVKPSVAVVFSLLDSMHDGLAPFLMHLLGENSVQKIKFVNQKVDIIKSAKVDPAASAVINCFKIQSYLNLNEHCDQFVADQVGLSKRKVKTIISELLHSSVIKLNKGKYEANQDYVNSSGLDTKLLTRNMQFWSERACARLNSESPICKGYAESLITYRVAALSKKASDEISNLIVQLSEKIRKIADSDSEVPVEVRIILLNHFSAKDI